MPEPAEIQAVAGVAGRIAGDGGQRYRRGHPRALGAARRRSPTGTAVRQPSLPLLCVTKRERRQPFLVMTKTHEVLEIAGRIAGEIGPIDLLVNNAGIGDFVLLEITRERWDRMLNVHLTGAYNWCWRWCRDTPAVVLRWSTFRPWPASAAISSETLTTRPHESRMIGLTKSLRWLRYAMCGLAPSRQALSIPNSRER